MLRTVERAREEERSQAQRWSEDLRVRFQAEKRFLVEKVTRLEAASTSGAIPDPGDHGRSSDAPAGDSHYHQQVRQSKRQLVPVCQPQPP